MGEHAQLDLAKVSGEQHVAGGGVKGAARRQNYVARRLAAALPVAWGRKHEGLGGQRLQVWVGVREAARRDGGLQDVRVDAAANNVPGQPLEERRLELRQLAILQDLPISK